MEEWKEGMEGMENHSGRGRHAGRADRIHAGSTVVEGRRVVISSGLLCWFGAGKMPAFQRLGGGAALRRNRGRDDRGHVWSRSRVAADFAGQIPALPSEPRCGGIAAWKPLLHCRSRVAADRTASERRATLSRRRNVALRRISRSRRPRPRLEAEPRRGGIAGRTGLGSRSRWPIRNLRAKRD